jgi:hypothetical protein
MLRVRLQAGSEYAAECRLKRSCDYRRFFVRDDKRRRQQNVIAARIVAK